MTVLRSPLYSPLRSPLRSPLASFKGGGGQLFGPYALARTRRIDEIGIGDSNELFGGHGQNQARHVAMSNAGAVMYATGLLSSNENGGDGGGTGYRYNFNASQRNDAFASTGAPADLDKYLDSTGSISPHNYAYLADAATFSNGENQGFIIDADCPIDPTAALDFHLVYGTFDSGSGQFRPSVRENASPYGQLAQAASAVSTNTGAVGYAVHTLSLAADPTRTKGLNYKFTSTSDGMVGPAFFLWWRAENVARTTGYAYHTLFGLGGSTAGDMADALEGDTDEMLALYFEEACRLQPAEKVVILSITAGINNSADAATFKADMRRMVKRAQEVWIAGGRELSGLWLNLKVGHDNPENAALALYRTELAELCEEFDQCFSYDLAALVPSSELTADDLYNTEEDQSHLKAAGYLRLAEREIRSTPSTYVLSSAYPGSAFDDGSDGYWYDGTGLYKDTTQTTVADDDGESVAYATDQSGNSNPAQQTNNSYRGVLKVISGKPAIRFDGAGQRLITIPPGLVMSSIFKIKATAVSDTVFGSATASNGRAYMGTDASGRLSAGVGTQSSVVIFGGSDIRNTIGVGWLIYDGSTVRLGWDDELIYEAAQSGAANTTVNMYLGAYNANGTVANLFAGDVYHAMAVMKAISVQKAKDIAAWMLDN